MEDKLSKVIMELVKVHDKRGEEIAEALNSIAYQIKHLGNGDAVDGGMGAIEGLSVQIKEGMESMSSALSEVAQNLEKEH